MHLDNDMWGYGLLDSNCVRNRLPSSRDPTKSRNELFSMQRDKDKHVCYLRSLKNAPIIPFGARVSAHIPLADQTRLGGRSLDCLFLGSAPGVKGGILLFNRSTRRPIVRATYRVIASITFSCNLWTSTSALTICIPYCCTTTLLTR